MDRQDYPKSSLLFESKLKKEGVHWSQRRKLSPKLFSSLFLSCCEQPKKVLKRLGKTSNNCFCFHPKVIHSESPSHQRANSNWVTQMEASLPLVSETSLSKQPYFSCQSKLFPFAFDQLSSEIEVCCEKRK